MRLQRPLIRLFLWALALGAGPAAAAGGPLQLGVPLPSAAEARAVLDLAPGGELLLQPVPVGAERLSLRLSRQAAEPALSFTVVGPQGAQRATPSPRAHFGGQVEGEPDSQAFLIADEAGSFQIILHRGGRSHVLRLQPPGTARAATVQSREIDPAVELAGRQFSCKSTEPSMLARVLTDSALDLHARVQQTLMRQGPESRAARNRRRADLIVETDHAFFQRFGNATEAGNYVRDLVAYVSTLYQAEVNTRLNLTDVRLYSTPANMPWTGTTTGALLDQLQNHWNAPERASIPRHHVHLLASAIDNGGLAIINALGAPRDSYGVTSSVIGVLDPTNPQLVGDAIILAHELGHTFGSEHSHAFDAPLIGSNAGGAIDCCNADNATGQCGLLLGGNNRPGPLPGPGSITGGTPGGRNGTIMSYCHITPDNAGNANIALTFGTNHPHGVNPGRVPQIMSASATTFLPLDAVAGSSILTVTRNGAGLGAVTSVPAGITCGIDCAEAYTNGTSVTLTATPAAGSRFTGWSGACTGTEPCTLTLSQARDVTASFGSTDAGSEAAKLQMQRVYVAYYGRPADPAGRSFWAVELDKAGGSLGAVIQSFGNSPEFNTRYGGLSNEDLISFIFLQLLNRLPDPAGLAFYLDELNSGRRSLQTITLDVLGGATAGDDALRVANKVEAAAYYTAKVSAGCPYGTIQQAVDYLTRVFSTVGSLNGAKASLDTRCGF